MSLLTQYANPVEEEEVLDPTDAEPESNGLGDLLELFETVSEEAFSVGDLNSWLQRKAATISAAVRDQFRVMTTWNFRKPEVINIQPLTRSLSTYQYTDITELEVYVPVGFQHQLQWYCNVLTNFSQPLASGALADVLFPSQKCFSYYINNLSESNESRELICKPKVTTADLTKVIEGEAEYFIQGNHRSTAPLGDVYENKAAIITVADMVNKLNHSLWQLVPPQKVKDETDKLVKLSTTLLGMLEGSKDQVNPVFIKSLMGQLYDVGKFIEWYATLMTRMSDLTSAIKMNEKILLDIQKAP
ncbi:virion structural protein [Pseudomonas phage Noxifer]|uniref:Virion structural protein n=1 Tax=Pseudomonas phage Noxifer TaxID=2006684 RepID=A0A1Y0SZW7_9CAUD|nr:virion structural protein [Pseudomonas phage Noxifer]ARV77333.1 virion structural protein [Pseudomonas phage Noxifer]